MKLFSRSVCFILQVEGHRRAARPAKLRLVSRGWRWYLEKNFRPKSPKKTNSCSSWLKRSDKKKSWQHVNKTSGKKKKEAEMTPSSEIQLTPERHFKMFYIWTINHSHPQVFSVIQQPSITFFPGRPIFRTYPHWTTLHTKWWIRHILFWMERTQPD